MSSCIQDNYQSMAYCCQHLYTNHTLQNLFIQVFSYLCKISNISCKFTTLYKLTVIVTCDSLCVPLTVVNNQTAVGIVIVCLCVPLTVVNNQTAAGIVIVCLCVPLTVVNNQTAVGIVIVCSLFVCTPNSGEQPNCSRKKCFHF